MLLITLFCSSSSTPSCSCSSHKNIEQKKKWNLFMLFSWVVTCLLFRFLDRFRCGVCVPLCLGYLLVIRLLLSFHNGLHDDRSFELIPKLSYFIAVITLIHSWWDFTQSTRSQIILIKQFKKEHFSWLLNRFFLEGWADTIECVFQKKKKNIMAIHFFDICLKAAVKGAFHGGTMHADGAQPGNKPK